MNFSFYFKEFLLLSYFVCYLSTGMAQKKEPAVSGKDLQTLEHQASNYFLLEKYSLAEPLYFKLDSLKPNTPDYCYKLGVCYIYNNKEDIALPIFEAGLKKATLYPKALLYYTAKAYHLNHKFDEAIKYYERYKGFVNKEGDKNKVTIIANLNRQIEMCRNGKELIKNPLPLEVFNLGPEINSQYPDYGPVVTADEEQVIFTSNRPNTTGGQKTEDGIYFEDIYLSRKTTNGWSPAVQMTELNTQGHDASKGINPNGEKMIIYRYGKDKLLSSSSGDLYLSEHKNGNWQKAERMSDKINSPGWEPSASLPDDDRIIYFVSNRQGGFGGTDIYSIKKLPNGEWAEPWNLGPGINTPYDEDSPFISPDGKTLYFSSTGHRSMGGYDIFITRFDETKKQWTTPENVGYPISTAQDDLYFSWSADGSRIYFSSVRPGGYGDKDIYYASIKKINNNVLILKGKILDAKDQKPLEAIIRISDPETNETITNVTTNSNTGKYLAVLQTGKKYRITFESTNFHIITENIDLSGPINSTELEKNIILEKY
jgi:tetratricopeptide (TPR) repeat protein